MSLFNLAALPSGAPLRNGIILEAEGREDVAEEDAAWDVQEIGRGTAVLDFGRPLGLSSLWFNDDNGLEEGTDDSAFIARERAGIPEGLDMDGPAVVRGLPGTVLAAPARTLAIDGVAVFAAAMGLGAGADGAAPFAPPEDVIDGGALARALLISGTIVAFDAGLRFEV